MDQLRLPFFIIAVIALAFAVVIEIGTPEVLGRFPPPQTAPLQQSLAQDLPQDAADKLKDVDPAELSALNKRDKPPGLAIRALAFIDGIALFTVLLIGAALIIPGKIQGQLQALATLIFSLLILIAGILTIVTALALVLLMVSLLLSIPFGTIVYFIIYGSFDRSGAQVALGLIFTLKLAFVIMLVLAQQRFLENKGLVLIVLTSLIASVVVSMLHGLVPRPLVSISDAVAAIVVAILAAIWAVILLIGAIIALIKGLNITKASG